MSPQLADGAGLTGRGGQPVGYPAEDLCRALAVDDHLMPASSSRRWEPCVYQVASLAAPAMFAAAR